MVASLAITYATRNKKKVALSFATVAGGQTLVWVDAFGRLSKPSTPIAMTGTVPTTP